jgi:hypothetical protein
MEFHETEVDEISWDSMENSMELHGIIFHEISWNSMKLRLMKFHGIPWKIPRNFMKFGFDRDGRVVIQCINGLLI